MNPTTTTRMKSEERRELVLDAATQVFGESGYQGATTDAVARAAGVSQPYVVRMFGTKEALFLAVVQRALDKLLAAFRAELAAGDDPGECLGRAYVGLLADRGLLLSLMHAFALGTHPEIGALARRGMLEVYRMVREEAGLDAEQAGGFLAHGMLINTVIAMRLGEADDPLAAELLGTVLSPGSGRLAGLDETRLSS